MLRHQATASLLSRRDVIVVASVSCIYGIGSPEDYAGLAPNVDKKVPLERDDFIHALIDIQYDRNDYDLARGTFRVRGDVVDVYPPYAEHPLRFEFFGDEVELIAEIDEVTGEMLREYEAIPVWPASHYVTEKPKVKAALKSISEECEKRVAELKATDKLLEAQRLQQRTDYDLEMLETMGFCNGIENYSRHLDGRKPGEPPFTLIDYFPKDMLCIIDESHVTVPQIRGMHEGDRSRKVTLVEHGFRLPSALDNRPLRFDEFEARIPQFIYVSATPGDYELRVSQNDVEQIIRPTGLLDPKIDVRPVRGQIDDLEDEIRERLAWVKGLGPRFVSATAGAEGCIAYDGERYYRQLAKPVTDMKDTMGAGDSFLTSFLMCYLDSAKRGEDGAEAIERALDFAAGFASTVCGMEGSWGHGAPIVE